MQSSTLTVPNRYSIPDTAEFFDGDTVIECLRSRYYAFRDYVVRVRRKACLAAVTHLQEAFSRFRAFTLQFSPEPSIPVAHVLYNSTGIDVSTGLQVGIVIDV